MSKGGFALAIFGTTLASVEADEIGTSNKVYELHVPVDDAPLLRQALELLRELAYNAK